MTDSFECRGFFSSEVEHQLVPEIRRDLEQWFDLTEKTNQALMRLVSEATSRVQTTSMNPLAVGVRVLLRSIGMYQGSILMAERGMIAESRSLARNVLEGAFAIAALLKSPEEFVEMLRDDSEKSRRMQAKFISDQRLVSDSKTILQIQALISQAGKPNYINQKAVASRGPLVAQYLTYQRLSDDSAHVTARSLNKHIHKNGEGWCYQWGPGPTEDNGATLSHIVSAAIAIGIGVSELIGNSSGAIEFTRLADLHAKMPPVKTI